MSRSWFERLKRWLHTEPASSGSFDPAAFEKLCIENPAAARAALLADQRSLAQEFERTYEAYEERIQGVAERLAGLSAEDVEKEARTLRKAQDELRRLLRRVDASAKSARDLEREISEWDSRGDQEGPWHADHPSVRAEILRSELLVRNAERRAVAIPPDQSPFRVVALEDDGEEIQENVERIMARRTAPAEAARASAEPLPELDPDVLLGTIRFETREAERWHGAPEQDYEAIEQVKNVKRLHAALKRLDRSRGIRRDRMVFAIHARGTH